MKKEDFLKTLTPNQREAVEILLDEAYANGYDNGRIEASFAFNW